MYENNTNNHERYNQLELLFFDNAMEYFMEFQPYAKKGLYIIEDTEFIIYNKTATEEQKIKFIDGVVNNRTQIFEATNNYTGYFNDLGFYHYTLKGMNVVLFHFLSIKSGDEHTALPFLKDDPCEGIEVFGYLENGDILGVKETEEYLKQQEIHRLKRMAILAYHNNIPVSSETKWFVGEYYKDVKTIEDVKLKFKELARVYHPDVGGDELVFKAVSNIKQYLIDYIRDKNIAA